MTLPFAVKGWQFDCGEVSVDLVVDIRTEDRFHRGHLPGARCLPYDQFQVHAAALARGHRVLVVDAAGARAAEMATWLRARDLDAAFLEGGMAAWTGALEAS